MGASSPVAFGLGLGDAFVAANVQSRVRYSDDPDATVAAGLGLGSPSRTAGLEITAISFSTLPSGGSPAGLGRVLGVDLKLHRLLPFGFGVAVGWESVFTTTYEGIETDGGSNRYVVVSKWISADQRVFSDVVLSAGLGSGRFLPERAWVETPNRLGPFGSVAARIVPAVSVVADWAGQELMAGASIAPLARYPLVFNLGFADLLGTTNGTGRGRLVASGSFAFRYLPR